MTPSPTAYPCICGALRGELCTDDNGKIKAISCPSRGNDGRSPGSPTAIRRKRGTQSERKPPGRDASLSLFGEKP